MFGLSFLNAFFLWGLAAASVPIIIHLIKRNRAVKLPFAAIRFLQIEPNKKVRSQRFKQILLLLLRVAAVLLLALAFARPFFPERDATVFWADEPKVAVILIDNSFSMGAANTLNRALAEVERLLSAFKPRDEVTVMQFAEGTQAVGRADADFSSLANRVASSVSISEQGTNYLQALQAAESLLLESPSRQRHIYLISDFQKTGWESLNPHWRLESGIMLDFVPISPEGPLTNVAVQDVHIGRKEGDGKKIEVLIKVKNYGGTKAKAKLALNLQTKRVAQRDLELLPDDEQIVQFSRVLVPSGVVTGEVSLTASDDALAIDNRYHFVVETGSNSEILVVNGEPKKDPTQDELFFFERAINLPGLARYSMTTVQQGGLDGVDFDKYRAVILANVDQVPRAIAERLGFYVRGGGGLVFALGDKTNPTVFNSLFQDLAPCKLNNRAFASLNQNNAVILAQVDYQHPIFRIFADPGQSDPSIAQFHQYYHTAPNSPEAVLASFDDGSPAILERKVGSGKVVLLTSSLDTEWNNLPVKAFYLPLIYQILGHVASEQKGHRSLLVGNPVPLREFGLRETELSLVSIRTPDGEAKVPESLLFEGSSAAGVYEVWRNGEKSPRGYFAVNVDARESDLRTTPPEVLQSTIAEVSHSDVKFASLGMEAVDTNIEKNQKLWRLAIVLVILLLFGETWLANRTHR